MSESVSRVTRHIATPVTPAYNPHTKPPKQRCTWRHGKHMCGEPRDHRAVIGSRSSHKCRDCDFTWTYDRGLQWRPPEGPKRYQRGESCV